MRLRPLSGFIGLLVLVGALATVPPAGAQGAAWKIDDGAGDVSPILETAPAVLTGPTTGHVDLRGVTLDGEDETSLVFTFRVENMLVQERPEPGSGFVARCGGTGAGSGGAGNPAFGQVHLTLDFSLADTPFKFALLARVLGEIAPNTNAFVAHSGLGLLCIHSGIGGARLYQSVPVKLEPNLVHVLVPKAALLGQLPPPSYPPSANAAARPASLKPGDRLTSFVATSYTTLTDTVLCCLGINAVTDRAPNTGTGPDYPLQQRTANGLLRLSTPGGMDFQPVVAGNQSVPLSLANHAAAKRLVRLSYEVIDGAGRVTPTGPAAITVGAGTTLNFSAAVNVSGSSEFEDTPLVRIRGESVGYPDELALTAIRLVSGQALTPESNVLYFHGGKQLGGTLAPAGESCHVYGFGGCRAAFLSPLESDPTAATPDEFQIRVSPSLSGDVARGAALISSSKPTGIPFALAPGQPILVELKATTLQASEVQVRVTLSYSAGPGGLAASLGTGIGSGSTGSSIKIPITVASRDPVIVPAGHHIRSTYEFSFPAGAGAPSAAAAGIKIIGKESKMLLPIIDLPPSALGPALQGTFQLRAVGGDQEFVNPGETRILNVTILNQAAENRTAKLVATPSLSGWTTQVLPSDSFNLQAGDLIRIGVRITAPADAKEGQFIGVWLNATDEKGALSSLRLSLIATAGVDLPNEAGPYEADDEVKSKIQAAPPTDTPWPAAPSVLAAFGAALAIRRRLRRA